MKATVQVSRGIESLFGTRDENIRLLESGLGISTRLGEDTLEIEGEPEAVSRAEGILQDYFALVREGVVFKNGDLNSLLRVVTADPEVTLRSLFKSGQQRSFGKKVLAPKTVTQRRYLEAIERNDLVFGIGPAGTGKTYLAVAMAIQALVSKRVTRIILTRPAVEAGEQSGFSAGQPAGKDRSLSAAALRCALRHAGIGQSGEAAGARVDRSGAARVHARAHAERQLHHSRRSAEQHGGTDEDGADAPGLQFEDGGDGRPDPDRSSKRAASADCWTRWRF